MSVTSSFHIAIPLTPRKASSWEYSFFAPQSMSSIVELMGGNDTFINRTTHYFNKGYFLSGNEPSFSMPLAFHYANRPDLSALRVRNVVFSNFGTGINGVRILFLCLCYFLLSVP